MSVLIEYIYLIAQKQIIDSLFMMKSKRFR